MAKVSEDPPSPVDAYATPVTAMPVGDPTATQTPPPPPPTMFYPATGVQYGTPPAASGELNVLALVALFASCLGFTVPGVIMGHIALHQIKRDGGSGRGLAIAALIVGYVLFVVIVAITIAWVAFTIWIVNIGSGYSSLGGIG